MKELIFYFHWEPMLIEWMQANLGTIGTLLAIFFTLCGDPAFYIALLCFLYFCWDKKLARYVSLNILVGITINSQLKNLVLRKRPYTVDSDIKCLRYPERKGDIYDMSLQGYSFPSGHATNSVTMYSSLALYTRKSIIMVLGVLMPLLIGLSRCMLGVHYPTDILFGWLSGIAVILIVPWLDKRIEDKRLFYMLIILISSPGWFYSTDKNYYTGFGALIGFILATEFEKRYVNFQETRKPLECILRIAGGIAIYLILNFLLKLPFSNEFLSSATTGAHAIRALRYAIIVFINLGIYPKIFDKFPKGQ